MKLRMPQNNKLYITPLTKVEIISGVLEGVTGYYINMKSDTYQVRIQGKTYGFTADQLRVIPNDQNPTTPKTIKQAGISTPKSIYTI